MLLRWLGRNDFAKPVRQVDHCIGRYFSDEMSRLKISEVVAKIDEDPAMPF